MGKVFFLIKKIVCAFLILVILIFTYLVLFTPKEKRFYIAEHLQGTYLSQKLFEVLIFQYPRYAKAYFEKSVPFNKRGDYATGFYLLDMAVDMRPEEHLGYRGWLKLHKLKDYRGAICDFIRLDTLTPDVIDAPWGENIHYLKGLSYKGLGKHQKALLEFNENLKTEIDSTWVNPNLYLYKGIVLKELGKYEEAIENLDACLNQTSNNSAEAFYQKGIVYKKLNQPDSSLKCFKMSKQLLENGRKLSDVYNEVEDELYLTDILNEISLLYE